MSKLMACLFKSLGQIKCAKVTQCYSSQGRLV